MAAITPPIKPCVFLQVKDFVLEAIRVLDNFVSALRTIVLVENTMITFLVKCLLVSRLSKGL